MCIRQNTFCNVLITINNSLNENDRKQNKIYFIIRSSSEFKPINHELTQTYTSSPHNNIVGGCFRRTTIDECICFRFEYLKMTNHCIPKSIPITLYLNNKYPPTLENDKT